MGESRSKKGCRRSSHKDVSVNVIFMNTTIAAIDSKMSALPKNKSRFAFEQIGFRPEMTKTTGSAGSTEQFLQGARHL